MVKPKHEIHHPPPYDEADARAVQALMLYAKTAETPLPPDQESVAPSPQDCKRALDWIIYKAAANYENGFLPNDVNGRTAAFMDGRRFVAQQIIKLGTMKIGKIFHGKRDEYSENGQDG